MGVITRQLCQEEGFDEEIRATFFVGVDISSHKDIFAQMEKEEKTVLVRYSSEVGIKRNSHVRHFFGRTHKRIELALSKQGVTFSMEPGHGHLFVRTKDWRPTKDILGRTFGIGAYYPCLFETDDAQRDAEAIVQTLRPLLKDKTFRVSCRKSDRASVSKGQMEKLWGSRLIHYSKGVDLDRAEIDIGIEILKGRTYFFSEKFPAPGGLPLSPRQRVLVLMSGGFDSPVAAWKMMKRGVCCDYVFFNPGGKAAERAVLEVAKELNDLWSPATEARFFAADFRAVFAAIKKGVDDPYRQIVLKRAMYKAACALASRGGHRALVTGESLGQVSSQTLGSLSSIEAGCPMSVLRPLIGEDKPEIISLARRIGSADRSEKIAELCGITQGQPITNPKIGRVDRQEEKIDPTLIERAVQSIRPRELESIEDHDLHVPYLFVDSLEDPEAIAIDCRTAALFQRGHAPGAIHIPASEVLGSTALLDKKKTYILYCDHGTETPYLAEALQGAGYQAYSLRGGAAKIGLFRKRHQGDKEPSPPPP